MNNNKLALIIIVSIVVVVGLVVGGYFLVKENSESSFEKSSNAIEETDKQVQNQMGRLFSKENRKTVVIPTSGKVSISRGESAGFGLSIRNKYDTEQNFQYEIKVERMDENCELSKEEAKNLIKSTPNREGIKLSSDSSTEQPINISFEIREDAPMCIINYGIYVQDSQGDSYSKETMELEITSSEGLF